MKKKTLQSGQALITMLLFVVISVIITSGAIIIILLNAKSTTQIAQSDICHTIAESGIENALLRLLRNTGYTGETMTLDGGTTVVQVTGSGNPYTITSSASLSTFRSTIQVTATETNNVFTVTSWKEL